MPEAQTDDFELHTSRLIILIHGYNNSQDEALDSYRKFLKNTGLDKATPIGQACGFLWPGDKAWGLFSMFSYPFELKPAKQSAALLHDFLVKQTVPGNWPLEVMIICHSLGSRVGLELVNQLVKRRSSNKLEYRACFMAAAVPVFMVESGGALSSAVRAVNQSMVLYSDDDIVLHFAFPLGQTVAGEGIFPRAVGRYGQPTGGVWSKRKDMGAHDYNHWHYWGHAESASSVRNFLGMTTKNVISTTEIASYKVQSKHALYERDTPCRKLPVRELATI